MVDDGPRHDEGEPVVGRVRPGLGHVHSLATLVLLAGIAAAIIGVVLPINQLTQPGASVPVTLADPQDGVVSPDGLPEGSSLQLAGSGDTVDLQVAELPAALRALSEASAFVSGLLALAGAWLLRRILVEIAAGRPFAPVVSRRLAGLAIVLVAASFVPSAVESVGSSVILAYLDQLGTGSPIGLPNLDVSLPAALGAILLGILATVFRHGAALTADVDGLV